MGTGEAPEGDEEAELTCGSELRVGVRQEDVHSGAF